MEIREERFHNHKFDVIEYHLYIEDKKVGYIGINLSSNEHFVTVSNVIKKHQNKGYGKLLYETALKNNNFISTKYSNISDAAKRVWDSLTKKYSHSREEDIITIYKKNE